MNWPIHVLALVQVALVVWFERKVLSPFKLLKWTHRSVVFIQLFLYLNYIYAVSVSNPGGWADLIYAVLFLYGSLGLGLLSLFILIYRRVKHLK